MGHAGPTRRLVIVAALHPDGDAGQPRRGAHRGLASSPYYPNIKPGQRIRLSVVWNAVTYRLFDGYVNDWPTSWAPVDTYSQVQITATDLFKPLARTRKLHGVLQEEALQDTPKGFWPMGDPQGSTAASDITGLSGPFISAVPVRSERTSLAPAPAPAMTG